MPTDIALDFSSAIAGTVLDKDGQGTGFSSVQPNTTNNAYDLGRIDLIPSSSSLVLTATQGSNGGTENTLKNALQVGIDATQPLTIGTRIKGLLTNLNAAYQQGGIYFGPNQDNYVKFVVVNTSSGTSGLGLQFNQEQNGVRSNVGGSSEIRNLPWSSINTLDLFLTLDPTTKTVQASYRVNSDTATPITLSQQFAPISASTFFSSDSIARAGVLAFTKSGPDVPITFDRFDVDYAQTQPPTGGTGGRLKVTTADAAIVPDRLVFSTVNEEVRAPKRITLQNTGADPLTITGFNFGDSLEKINAVRLVDHERAADFNLVNAPNLPLTLAPNASVDLLVQFAPQRVSSISNTATHLLNGENYASLTISTNDPNQPTRTVNLAGLGFADYEGKNEPAIAEIARTFGWKMNVGAESLVLGGKKAPLGEEVYSAYWQRADTSKPVYLWPLAVTSGRVDKNHGGIRFEAKPGSGGNSGFLYEFAGRLNDDSPTGTEVLGSNNLSGGENQKLLPKIFVNSSNSTPTPSNVDFTPTAAFALNNSGTWSDDIKNGSGQLHNWRFYPVHDVRGNLVANQWFAIQDIGNTEGSPKNYDYNDHVYLLVNAKPDALPASSIPYRLDTGSSASYRDSQGNLWSPDVTRYTPLTALAENGGSPPPDIANTVDDALYQTYRGRVGTTSTPLADRVLTYNLPIATAQKVDIQLHFAEMYWGAPGKGPGGPGKRVFDVTAEGTTVLSNYDITVASGGALRAVTADIKGIQVNDGALTLQFKPKVDFASISGIEVFPSV